MGTAFDVFQLFARMREGSKGEGVAGKGLKPGGMENEEMGAAVE
jgi:hypothetical protein